MPDGRKLAVGGFQVVDADRFAALPDATVVDWHRKGWLALVHFHLSSLERFSVLLDRQQSVVGVSQQNGSEDRVAVETGRKPKSRKA